MNKVKYGQYFTKHEDLHADITDLINVQPINVNAKCLEPSCGEGHLTALLETIGFKNITSIEIDKTLEVVCETKISYQSFFDKLPLTFFDLIIGNPPYVKQSLLETEDIPKQSLLSSANLYMYFIEKAFNVLAANGAIIFILPKDFLTSTRGADLRKMLHDNGTITHVLDYQEKRLFTDASPQVILIRYEKNNMTHRTKYLDKISDSEEELCETIQGGKYIFVPEDNGNIKSLVSQFYDVCVGLVSGCNEVFRLTDEDICDWSEAERASCIIDVLCSDGTVKMHLDVNGETLDAIEEKYPRVFEYLRDNEVRLRQRRIVKMTDKNWFKWGAVRNLERMTKPLTENYIYVRMKSRKSDPFWIGKAGYFDGSVIALCPKPGVGMAKMKEHVNTLNAQNDEYRRRGILSHTRYSFTQGSLNLINV